MREPLMPMAAYQTDVRDGTRWVGHPTQPHGWFSITHIAVRVAHLPPEHRLRFLQTLPEELLPDPSRRPTHVDHDQPRPDDPFVVAAEQFRVAAEDMERDLCFEMAYATVSAAAQIVARHDAASVLSATNHLARIVRQLGETATAEEMYQQVAVEAEQRGYPCVAGYALGGLGNLAIMRGNRPAQLQLFSRVLAIAKLDSPLESVARWGLMNHALAMDSLADALLHGWRVYDLSTSDEQRAGVLHNLASVALRGHFVDEAMAGLEGALRLARTSRVWLAVAATAAEAAGLVGKSSLLMTLEESGRRHGGTPIPFEHGQWLLGLAKGWTSLGSLEAAERFTREALALAQRHEFHELSFRADELLAQITAPVKKAPAPAETFPSRENLTESTRSGLARLCTLAA